MTDIFSSLKELVWRHPSITEDFVLPITSRDVGFQHEDAQYAFNFRENNTIEGLGAKNLTFSYVIPFREDIAKGPFKNLFVTIYPKFLTTARSQLSGVLIDPILGEFPAKVTTYQEITDINRRDGIDVNVAFIHTPSDDETRTFPLKGFDDILTEAGQLDVAVGEIDPLLWADRQLPPPKPLVPFLNAIRGVLDQINAQGNRIVASIHQLASQLEALQDSAERLQDPKRSPQISAACRRLRVALIDLEKTAARPDKAVGTFLVQTKMTFTELAKTLSMTVEELVQLNPTLVKYNLVLPGIKVLRYLSDGRVFINHRNVNSNT